MPPDKNGKKAGGIYHIRRPNKYSILLAFADRLWYYLYMDKNIYNIELTDLTYGRGQDPEGEYRQVAVHKASGTEGIFMGRAPMESFLLRGHGQ